MPPLTGSGTRSTEIRRRVPGSTAGPATTSTWSTTRSVQDRCSAPSGLSCKDLPVATLGTIPAGGRCPTAKTGANFPSLAIDRAGSLYAVWEQAPQDPNTCQITGDTVLKYSYSTDEGDHWSKPITIPTPG